MAEAGGKGGVPARLKFDPGMGNEFRELPFVLRGEDGDEADERARAWMDASGERASRDYIAIDESGDFDDPAASRASFLISAAVHTDAGNYHRVADLFLPWRRIVYAGGEVKASSGLLDAASEERFLKELQLACHAGYCVVTVGIVDKIAHKAGALLKEAGSHDLRIQLHDDLMRRHLRLTPPRSESLLLLVDQYGLDRKRQDDYERSLARTLRDLSLGGVTPRVQFCDSMVVELVQVADLVAGRLRRRLDNNDFTLLEKVSDDFVIRDLTRP